jgi:RNA recognition motif-containing protein
LGNRLYVGNLPFSVTEDSLRAVLQQAGGTCKDLHIVTDRETGRPRGFAFAEMASDAEAQAVIGRWDGKPYEGRNLTVNEAKPRTSGGGDRFGGDRSGGDRSGGDRSGGGRRR